MSQNLSADQELVSDVVACQLVIKQILDVIDVIAPVEVREKMSTQLKNIDFTNHPAAADPVTSHTKINRCFKIRNSFLLLRRRATEPVARRRIRRTSVPADSSPRRHS